MRISTLAIFMILGVAASQAQVSLVRKKIGQDISIKIPETFIAMSEAERNQKYVSYRSPLAMFTNIERTVDLGINETSSTWQADDLVILKDFYKANILSLYNEVSFDQETIESIGSRDYIVFEFSSKVFNEGGFRKDAVAKYTYIQYTLFNDKVLLFHFSSPFLLRSQWQPVAQEIMKSVRLQ